MAGRISTLPRTGGQLEVRDCGNLTGTRPGGVLRAPRGAGDGADAQSKLLDAVHFAPAKTSQGLCLDGGIADSIPFEYAQLAGFDKIVVIRTREREYRKRRTQSPLRYAYEHAFAQYPEFVKAAAARPEMYNRQADKLDDLEEAGQVFVIAPAEPVTVGRLEGNTDKLEALYETGLEQTQALIPDLRSYLTK